MPQAIEADWQLIQTLYTAGTSAKEIAQQTGVKVGTIQTRASREDWRRLSTAVSSKVKSIARDALESVGNELRKELGLKLKRHVEKLPEPKGWKHAAKLNAELEPLVRNAKTVFGWNESTSQPAVRINVLASAVRIEETSTTAEKASFSDTATTGKGE